MRNGETVFDAAAAKRQRLLGHTGLRHDERVERHIPRRESVRDGDERDQAERERVQLVGGARWQVVQDELDQDDHGLL